MQACHVAISLPSASPFQSNTLGRTITPDIATRCLPLRDQKRNTVPRQTNTLTDLATIRTQTARNTIKTTAPRVVPKTDLHPVPTHPQSITQMLATTKGRRTNRQMRPNTALLSNERSDKSSDHACWFESRLNSPPAYDIGQPYPGVCQYRFKITPLFRLNNGSYPSPPFGLLLRPL